MSLVRFFLSGVCHQYPEHCLHFQGQPLPLCARCTGTFLGVVITLAALWAMGQGRRRHLPPWQAGLILLGLLGIWAIDGLNSFVYTLLGGMSLYEPSNALRLITGLGSGLTLGAVLYPVYHMAFWRHTVARPVLDRPRHLAVVAGIVAAVGTVVYYWRSVPLIYVTGLAAMIVAGTLVVVNALVIVLLVGREGRVTRTWELLPWFATGLAATLLETGALAVFRAWLGI